MRVRFSVCVFDSEQHSVICNGRDVALTPKAFELLRMLIEAHPATVAHEELYERLWPTINVEPGNLHGLVSEIRSAIGDHERRVIRTVYRVGYALGGEVASERAEAPFAVFLTLGGRQIPLVGGANVIGRDGGNDVVLDSEDVSRRHARIVVSQDTLSIEDLGSKNGTWLNGERLTRPRALRDGDQIIVGHTPLRVLVQRSGDRTATISHEHDDADHGQ